LSTVLNLPAQGLFFASVTGGTSIPIDASTGCSQASTLGTAVLPLELDATGAASDCPATSTKVVARITARALLRNIAIPPRTVLLG
jgi:hypothetical protein